MLHSYFIGSLPTLYSFLSINKHNWQLCEFMHAYNNSPALPSKTILKINSAIISKKSDYVLIAY